MWIFPAGSLTDTKQVLFQVCSPLARAFVEFSKTVPSSADFSLQGEGKEVGAGSWEEGGEEARSREHSAQEGAVAICARGGLSSASSPRVLKWEGVQIPSLPSGLHFLPLMCKRLRHPHSLEGGGCATIVGGRRVMITVRVCNSFFFFLSQHKEVVGEGVGESKSSVLWGHRVRTREPQEPKKLLLRLGGN